MKMYVPTFEQNKTISENLTFGVQHLVDVNLAELHICKKKMPIIIEQNTNNSI